MVQGDIYRIDRQDLMAYPLVVPAVDRVQDRSDNEGGYLQARWSRTTAGGERAVQFSYDKTRLDYPFMGSNLDNLTVEYQERFRAGERHEIYLGAGYQQYWDDGESRRVTRFDPAAYVYRAGDVVARDEWQIVPGRLLGSAGVRFDYNSYRQFEYQPSLRLLYTPDSQRSLWLAALRAVRVPSRLDRDFRHVNGGLDMGGIPMIVCLAGSTSTRSETARSLEAGYRRQSGQRWSLDASVFWSHYGRLRAFHSSPQPQLDLSGPVPSLAMLMMYDNAGAGRTRGGEVWAHWQVRPGWRLLPSYAYVQDTRRLPSPTADFVYVWDRAPSDLRHQALLRSQHDLSRKLQLDLMVRARSCDLTFGTPGTLLADARICWRPARPTEISFSAENLTGRTILEAYPETAFTAIPLRRLFVVKLVQRF